MEGNGIFNGTFMAEILELLNKGEFHMELGPMEEGEEVVGEMTPLEKAIFSLCHAKIDNLKAICETCDDKPEDKASPKCALAQTFKDQAETLKRIGFQLIEDRLNRHKDPLGIREGFQIVKHPEDHMQGIHGLPGLTVFERGGVRIG